MDTALLIGVVFVLVGMVGVMVGVVLAVLYDAFMNTLDDLEHICGWKDHDDRTE